MKPPSRERNQHTRDQFVETVLGYRLKKRIDIFILLGVPSALAILLFLVSLSVNYAKGQGLLEPPIRRPIEDERLLKNVVEPGAGAFLDAVYHQPDDRVYLSRRGGTVFRYQPATHLWDQADPFRNNPDLDPQFKTMRSGCGADPDTANHRDCPDHRSLWAVTESGALARRFKGKWRIVVSDTRFIGSDGEPVNHDPLTGTATPKEKALTTAAISADGVWLCLGTSSQGMGFYHLPTRRWLTQQHEKTALEPPITHLLWWRDYFWRGGPNGLTKIDLAGGTPHSETIAITAPHIRDMDVGPKDRLWVLAERGTGEKARLVLYRFESPELPPVMVLDAGERHDSLNLQHLHYALYHQSDLYLAGQNGIFRYNAQRHGWKRFFGDKPYPVHVTHSFDNRAGFYFGAGNDVGYVAGDKAVPFSLSDRVRQLTSGPGTTLALGESGKLYEINEKEEPKVLYQATGSRLPLKSFRRAVSWEDYTLLDGEKGMLLHDAAARTYRDFPNASLPNFLRNKNKLIISGNQIYSVDRAGREARVFSAPLGGFLTGWSGLSAHEEVLPAGVHRTREWSPDGLAIIDGNRRAYKMGPAKLEAFTGNAGPIKYMTQIKDVAKIDGGMRLLGADGIYDYNYGDRTWRKVAPHPRDDRITHMAPIPASDHFYARGQSGRLLRWNGSRWARLAGGTTKFRFDDGQLSDGQSDGSGDLFLAGAGVVQRYSPDTRDIIKKWELHTDSRVQLIDILAEKPLALSAGQVYWGETMVRSGGERAVNVSLSEDDQTLAIVRQDDKNHFLDIRPDSDDNWSERRCLFRNPDPVNPIYRVWDALDMGRDAYAISSNGGLDFYSLKARSWFHALDPAGANVARLFRLGDQYFMGPSRSPGSLVRFQGFQMPDSCSENLVTLHNEVATRVEGFTINTDAKKAAWLEQENGRVFLWPGHEMGPVLPAASEQKPRVDSLERVYDGKEWWCFTSSLAVWSYHLQKRQWSKTYLPQSGGFENLNLEPTGSESWPATAKRGDVLYSGDFRPDSEYLELAKIYRSPAGQSMSHPAADLLRVYRTRNNSLWTLVTEEGLDFFQPDQRRWLSGITLDERQKDREIKNLNGYDLIVENNGRRWRRLQWNSRDGAAPQVFQAYDLPGGYQAALDGDGHIRELAPDGSLYLKSWSARRISSTKQADPFILPSMDVRFAFEFGGYTVFGDESSIRFYHDNGNTTGERGKPIAMGNLAYALGFGLDRLWLGNGTDLVLLDLERTPTVLKRTYGVSKLVVAKNKTIWIYKNGTWWYWDDSGGRSSGEWANPGTNLNKVWVYEGAATTALAGLDVYQWNINGFSRVLPLPNDISQGTAFNLDEAYLLARGNDDDWWAIYGNELLYITRGSCTRTVISGQQPTSGSPTPAPRIESYPCLEIRARLDLNKVENWPGAHLIETVHTETNFDGPDEMATLVLGFPNRVVHAFRYQNGALIRGRDPLPGADPSTIKNQWEDLKTRVRLIGGVNSFDPVTHLVSKAGGGLYAKRPGGDRLLSPTGSLTPQKISALSLPWLSFDANSKTFRVANLKGNRHVFKPHEFIKRGRFLFETAEAVLAQSKRAYFIANRHGVWRHTRSDLALNDPNIAYLPLEWQPPFRVGHGRIFSAAQTFEAATLTLNADPFLHQVSADDLRIEELDPRKPSLRATIRIGGDKRPAFDPDGGFVWDHQRKGLAFIEDRLFLQCRIGLIPTDGYQQIDPGPRGTGSGENPLLDGRLHCDSSRQLHLYYGNAWWRRDAWGSWTPEVDDPDENPSRLTGNQTTWKWEIDGGQLEIQIAKPKSADRFEYFSNGRLAFSSDRLQGAAFLGNHLHVITHAFHEVFPTGSVPAGFAQNRFRSEETLRLQTIEQPGKRKTMYLTAPGETVKSWNVKTSRFQSVDPVDNPYRKRVLLQNDRLRFQAITGRFGEQTIDKALKVDQPGGGQTWASFKFDDGRFPFDRFTTLKLLDGSLLLGTKAGLQVAGGGQNIGLLQLAEHLDMRTRGESDLPAVNRIGKPDLEKKLFAACADRSCLTRSGGPWSLVSNDNLLNRQPLAQDFLWQWRRREKGVVGNYWDDRSGSYRTNTVELDNGWFSHDRFQDLIQFEDKVFQIWEKGWVTVYPDIQPQGKLPISEGIFNFEGDARVLNWISVQEDHRWSLGTIAKGLYVHHPAQNQLWEYREQLPVPEWKEVNTNSLKTDLVDFSRYPLAWHKEHLRLRYPKPKKDFHFEWRNQAGQWQQIPWAERTVADAPRCLQIDAWQQVYYHGNTLWTASEFGFTAFDFNGLKPALDPNRLLIVREPAGLADAPMKVTDSGLFDDQILFRFDHSGEKLFRADFASGKDTGVFTTWEGPDPFVEVNRVDEPFWKWRTVACENGQPGRLEAEFKGEPVQVDSGRFSFDTLNSLAFSGGAFWELGTDSGGWYRISGDDWHLSQLARPTVAGVDEDRVRRVDGVALMHDPETKAMGLLLSEREDFHLLRPDRETDHPLTPSVFLAEDTLWRYERIGDELSISPLRPVGGISQRILEEGRFGDDWVTGPPAPGLIEDEPKYLLPTKVGILELDDHLFPQKIHGPPFVAGRQDIPVAVWFPRADQPAFALGGETYQLLGERSRMEDYPFEIPKDATLETVEWGPGQSFRQRWHLGKQQGWSLSWREETGYHNYRRLNMEGSILLAAQRSFWGFTPEYLDFAFNGKEMILRYPQEGEASPRKIEWPLGSNFLEMVPYRYRLLIFGHRTLEEINTEAAFKELMPK